MKMIGKNASLGLVVFGLFYAAIACGDTYRCLNSNDQFEYTNWPCASDGSLAPAPVLSVPAPASPVITEDDANGQRFRGETRQDVMNEVCEKKRKEIDESTYQPKTIAGALVKHRQQQNYERDCVFGSSSDSGVTKSQKQKPADAFFTGRMEQMPTGEWNCQYNYYGQNIWKTYRVFCPSSATGAND